MDMPIVGRLVVAGPGSKSDSEGRNGEVELEVKVGEGESMGLVVERDAEH